MVAIISGYMVVLTHDQSMNPKVLAYLPGINVLDSRELLNGSIGFKLQSFDEAVRLFQVSNDRDLELQP